MTAIAQTCPRPNLLLSTFNGHDQELTENAFLQIFYYLSRLCNIPGSYETDVQPADITLKALSSRFVWWVWWELNETCNVTPLSHLFVTNMIFSSYLMPNHSPQFDTSKQQHRVHGTAGRRLWRTQKSTWRSTTGLCQRTARCNTTFLLALFFTRSCRHGWQQQPQQVAQTQPLLLVSWSS